MCKTISCRSATSKYPLGRSASPTKMKVAAHHEAAAAGRTRRQNSRTTCMRMLSASRSQNGNTYWQLAARRALQLGATATESRRGSLPHLLRTHVAEDGGQGSDPAAAAHRHIVGNARTHADLAAALEVHGADMQLLPHPPGHGDMGSGLDGHIVPDGEEVQWSGELDVVVALEVVTHGRPEPA